jgi:hypothetical protein
MAPFETIWPNEMHVLPTPAALAAKLLCGHPALTSSIALASMAWKWTSGRDIETVNDLADAGHDLGLHVGVAFTPNARVQPLP